MKMMKKVCKRYNVKIWEMGILKYAIKMGICMLENLIKVRKMDGELITIIMERSTLGVLSMMKSMGMEDITSYREQSMKETGAVA